MFYMIFPWKRTGIQMNYNDLLLEFSDIPIDRKGIRKNLNLLLNHVKQLEKRSDITEPLTRGILDAAQPYIRKQIERLQKSIDEDADFIAWISRSLMELLFMLRYMYSSRDKYDEGIKEQFNDLRDIEKIIYPEGAPSEDDPEEIRVFHKDMRKLWDAVKDYGIDQDDLGRPHQAYYYAEGSDMLDEYKANFKIHSKYVHPTAYLLFGNQEFVYGDGSRLYFWALVQFYAARNLRDLYMMIEAIPQNAA